ncbi:helix-turn-helix domain-containing protein [Sulfurospirillum cavolei]|uniref:helix-turn-helix domain-containing protein n=1 Tax=Sulfurospirillum cavolei TaxID=366522 RepID=UPI0006938B4B|nr:XRE family transcriptional regulator [Sulfurospirillum cavolei]
MKIGTNVRSARVDAGLTQLELAKKLNISVRALQNYENGERDISAELLWNIADIFNLDMSYFVPKKVSLNVPKSVPILSPNQQVVERVQQTNTVKVNYYPNILASAGFGAFNHDLNVRVLELEEGFLMALGLKCFKNLDLITVYGDSMEPFVSNGELIILQRDVEAQNSDIVVANINGEVYVKKLQKDPIRKWIKLTSLNTMYPDIELNEDEQKYLSIIGIVRAKIRPF